MIIALKEQHILLQKVIARIYIYVVRILYSHLKIFDTNADTHLNNLNELRLIIEASCYDVVVITEVKTKNSCFCVSKSVIYLDGYQLFWNSDLYEASRGISIYVRSYISATIDTNLTCDGLHESLWPCISLMKGDSLCWVVFTEIHHHPPQAMTTLLTC